ncbi:hypothetical protein [Halomonas alkalisoli]|uniref:hypothetical protein n=1 Tax=Halomonas alkalisoli TaxID=2907158 RepID=UPI001F28ED74|nr:hypothetical protein [Halomonas alkalisoli]MCE9680865.1 hypothetical protein [Halomonas alkalisoli]
MNAKEIAFDLEAKWGHLGRRNLEALAADVLRLTSTRGDSADDEMEIQRQAQQRLHEQSQRLEKHRERQRGQMDEAAAAIQNQWKRGKQ